MSFSESYCRRSSIYLPVSFFNRAARPARAPVRGGHRLLDERLSPGPGRKLLSSGDQAAAGGGRREGAPTRMR